MKKTKFKSFSTVIIALFLISTFFLSSMTSVEASDSQVTEAEKINFLKNKGTTDEALTSYTPKQIDDLYDTLYGQDAHFSGFDSKIVEVAEANSDERENISTTKLQLMIGTYDLVSNGIVKGVDVSIGYKWLKDPMIHLTDALTFSWDNNTFYDDGFYATANCNVDGVPILLENINAPALAGSSSFGWYSTISQPQSGPADYFYGGAQVLLRPKTPFSSSATLHSKLYLTYAHQKLGGSISFGLSSSGPNIGVSITGGNYDQQSLSYTYH